MVHVASFEEGMGSIMFVAGALECERPFLGPLYKIITLHPRNPAAHVVQLVRPNVSL